MKTLKEAREYGTISTGNSRMPGTTFSVDAFACSLGDVLASIAGTTCSRCYARRIQKFRPHVDRAWKENLSKWKASTPKDWEDSMVYQLDRKCKDGWHRWFVAGDLQSMSMLCSIVNICTRTPGISHWLPTQEHTLVHEYRRRYGDFPSNLCVRVSAVLVDTSLKGEPLSSCSFRKATGVPEGATECTARSRGNTCGSCRLCWDRNVSTIAYPLH